MEGLHPLLPQGPVRTSLLVSHRLAAIRTADEIVVLAGGRVAERGTHAELIARDGEYARLFTLQASGYTALPDEPVPNGYDGSRPEPDGVMR